MTSTKVTVRFECLHHINLLDSNVSISVLLRQASSCPCVGVSMHPSNRSECKLDADASVYIHSLTHTDCCNWVSAGLSPAQAAESVPSTPSYQLVPTFQVLNRNPKA